MEDELINCFDLDIKQNFPEDIRLAQEQNKSLENTNKVLTAVLVIIGVGLSIAFIYSQIAKRKTRQKDY
ncbi:hypothetical protein [Psychroserpens algicola]|uniref:Uncharacterized protein n=1 Tax=Psychroserpens algicola TaxID=1719034 RepID=A0ABT0H5V9_9FLAO|nr:hypothetical protein [Psychroserpens algicola]MCK8479762.1 hypothetical protein [Psychroserpens algicola]